MTKSYISHVSKTNNKKFQHIISLLNSQQVNPNKRCYPEYSKYKYNVVQKSHLSIWNNYILHQILENKD